MFGDRHEEQFRMLNEIGFYWGGEPRVEWNIRFVGMVIHWFRENFQVISPLAIAGEQAAQRLQKLPGTKETVFFRRRADTFAK